jgi:heme oxygenase
VIGEQPGRADARGDRQACGTRREALRRATAAIHQTLEHTLVASGSFAGIAGYGRYLATIAPLYAGLEQALDAAGVARLLPDWPARRKAGVIQADLACLSMKPREACPVLPALHGAGCAFGVLYVLEGATLGGAVLARRMARHGIGPGHGGSFLDPYGPRRAAMWRGFLAALETAPLGPDQDAAPSLAATATFALFLREAQALAGPAP